MVGGSHSQVSLGLHEGRRTLERLPLQDASQVNVLGILDIIVSTIAIHCDETRIDVMHI